MTARPYLKMKMTDGREFQLHLIDGGCVLKEGGRELGRLAFANGDVRQIDRAELERFVQKHIDGGPS